MRDIPTFDRKIRELVASQKRRGNPKVEAEHVQDATSVMLFPEQIDTVLSILNGNGFMQHESVTATVGQWIEAYSLVYNAEHLRAAIDKSLTRAWNLERPKRAELGGSPRRFSTAWWST